MSDLVNLHENEIEPVQGCQCRPCCNRLAARKAAQMVVSRMALVDTSRPLPIAERQYHEIKSLNTEIAALKTEIGRLREALKIATDCGAEILVWSGDKGMVRAIKEAQRKIAALTPPSQAPEARRDVGGEKGGKL